MVAIMVILTILAFLAVDAIQLYVKSVQRNRALAKDPAAFFDPNLGWCMCDGGERIDKDEEKKEA
jgi:hypothetical protein